MRAGDVTAPKQGTLWQEDSKIRHIVITTLYILFLVSKQLNIELLHSSLLRGDMSCHGVYQSGALADEWTSEVLQVVKNTNPHGWWAQVMLELRAVEIVSNIRIPSPCIGINWWVSN